MMSWGNDTEGSTIDDGISNDVLVNDTEDVTLCKGISNDVPGNDTEVLWVIVHWVII